MQIGEDMMKAFAFMLMAILVATGACLAVADDVGEANRLIVEAAGLMGQAKDEALAVDARYEAAVKALANLEAVVDEHPSSNHAVTLATGGSIGSLELSAVRYVVARLKMAVMEQRRSEDPILQARYERAIKALDRIQYNYNFDPWARERLREAMGGELSDLGVDEVVAIAEEGFDAVVAEALRQLGQVEGKLGYSSRRALVGRATAAVWAFSDAPDVRDDLFGTVSMEFARAAFAKGSMSVENIRTLLVLSELVSTKDARDNTAPSPSARTHAELARLFMANGDEAMASRLTRLVWMYSSELKDELVLELWGEHPGREYWQAQEAILKERFSE